MGSSLVQFLSIDSIWASGQSFEGFRKGQGEEGKKSSQLQRRETVTVTRLSKRLGCDLGVLTGDF